MIVDNHNYHNNKLIIEISQLLLSLLGCSIKGSSENGLLANNRPRRAKYVLCLWKNGWIKFPQKYFLGGSGGGGVCIFDGGHCLPYPLALLVGVGAPD